jgi:YHS domain-containing protein
MKKMALAGFLVFVAQALANDVKPYPLSTCIVSDEPLDESRRPISIVYQGQEVKVCCRECRADFKNSPEEFLKKISTVE